MTQEQLTPEQKIKQLESDNALLVEEATNAKNEIMEINPNNYTDDDVREMNACGVQAILMLEAALTNTTQAAQARDARLREEGRQAGLDEAARRLWTFKGLADDLVDYGQAISTRIAIDHCRQEVEKLKNGGLKNND